MSDGNVLERFVVFLALFCKRPVLTDILVVFPTRPINIRPIAEPCTALKMG